MVEILFDVGAHIDAWIDGRGDALYTAIDNGNETVVRLLIGRGADANGGGALGSLLYIASWRNRTEMMKILLQAGADVNAESEPFGSPLLCGFRFTAVGERNINVTGGSRSGR